jgi:hypothetical protein
LYELPAWESLAFQSVIVGVTPVELGVLADYTFGVYVSVDICVGCTVILTV